MLHSETSGDFESSNVTVGGNVTSLVSESSVGQVAATRPMTSRLKSERSEMVRNHLSVNFKIVFDPPCSDLFELRVLFFLQVVHPSILRGVV